MDVPDSVMDELQAFLVVWHYIEETTFPGTKPNYLGLQNLAKENK